MAELQPYGHKDIQRYLQQKMSPQEMHEFEKALMNDPLLADALEGFSKSENELATSHIDAIERFVNGNIEGAKVIHLTATKTLWWKVAAIVVFFLSAGVFTYTVLDNRNSTISYHPISESGPEIIAPARPPESGTETPLAKGKTAEETKPRGNLNRQERLPSDRTYYTSIPKQNKKEVTNKEAGLKQTTLTSPSIAAANPNNESGQANLEVTAPDPENDLNAGDLRKPAETLANASIVMKKNSRATFSDTNRNTADSDLKIKRNHPGLAANQKSNDIVKQENKNAANGDQLTLAEQVITTLENYKLPAIIRHDSSSATQPVEGWDHFQQYIDRQLDSLKEIEPAISKIKIELEFSIEKNGRPTKIKAINAEDKATGARIIDMLAKGPRWIFRKAENKVKITIQF